MHTRRPGLLCDVRDETPSSGLPGVLGALDPFQVGAISPDRQHALIQVQFAQRADKVTKDERAAYERSGAAAEAAGLRVEHGGEVMSAEPEVGGQEGIGVVIALIVLVVTFGSLVAAGMTMLNALIGVGAGMAGRVQYEGDVLTAEVADDAGPFNPLLVPAPDTTSPLEVRQPGGLGIALVRALTDDLTYERRDDRNRLIMTWRV